MSERKSSQAFSEAEEEFFRAGEAADPDPVDTFADLDDGRRPVSLWQRLFARGSRR
jgi:hypothetical protein